MSQLGVRNIGGYNEKRRRGARARGEVLTRQRADRLRPRDRPADVRGPAARPRAAALHRRRHRRDGRPDDGRRQGDRGRGAAPGADGARRRHPRHHGDAAALGRRHHRHHQGQLPDPHLLPGDQQDRQPHHPGRAGRRAAARPGRHAATWPAAAASPACTAPSSATSEVEKVVGLPARAGRAGLYRGGHRGARTRTTATTRRCPASPAPRMARRACSTRRSPWWRARARPAPASSSATCNIGYNRAAKLIEQMEKEGVVGPANHVGKREVLTRRTERGDG